MYKEGSDQGCEGVSADEEAAARVAEVQDLPRQGHMFRSCEEGTADACVGTCTTTTTRGGMEVCVECGP